jgi:hypothetical protein
MLGLGGCPQDTRWRQVRVSRSVDHFCSPPSGVRFPPPPPPLRKNLKRWNSRDPHRRVPRKVPQGRGRWAHRSGPSGSARASALLHFKRLGLDRGRLAGAPASSGQTIRRRTWKAPNPAPPEPALRGPLRAPDRGGGAPATAVRPVRLELSPSTGARADARGVSARRCLATDHRPVGFLTVAPGPTGGPLRPPRPTDCALRCYGAGEHSANVRDGGDSVNFRKNPVRGPYLPNGSSRSCRSHPRSPPRRAPHDGAGSETLPARPRAREDS